MITIAHKTYKMDPLKEKRDTFKLLYITHSEYDKNWHSTPHTHHFTELFYIVSGKGSFILPTHEVAVKENDLVIINPHTEHTERSNSKDSLEYIALGLEGVSFTLPEKDEHIGLFTYQGDRKDILFYLNKLLQEVNNGDEEYDMICHYIISILIVKLKRAKKVDVQNDASIPMNQAVALAKHYIEHNYEEDLTLDILSKVCNINKYYLSHMFKESIGLSPIEYVNNIRMKEAKTLLETTDYTISDVAMFTGFSSQSFFTQSFKRHTNTTPSKFRKESHL